mmetsp:Transcript_28431/g.66008  ORF Transcript_28431/g.66008 Transcript_28431/m.66008 type:complete len:147 (+) Transcript_28431:1248-1688(+)
MIRRQQRRANGTHPMTRNLGWIHATEGPLSVHKYRPVSVLKSLGIHAPRCDTTSPHKQCGKIISPILMMRFPPIGKCRTPLSSGFLGFRASTDWLFALWKHGTIKVFATNLCTTPQYTKSAGQSNFFCSFLDLLVYAMPLKNKYVV